MNRLWIIIRRIIQKFPARTSTGTKQSLTRPTFWVPTTAVVSRWWRESTTCVYVCVYALNQRVSCRVVYPIHVTQRADSGDCVKVTRGGETRNLFALRSSNSPLHQTQSRRPRLFYYNPPCSNCSWNKGGWRAITIIIKRKQNSTLCFWTKNSQLDKNTRWFCHEYTNSSRRGSSARVVCLRLESQLQAAGGQQHTYMRETCTAANPPLLPFLPYNTHAQATVLS